MLPFVRRCLSNTLHEQQILFKHIKTSILHYYEEGESIGMNDFTTMTYSPVLEEYIERYIFGLQNL